MNIPSEDELSHEIRSATRAAVADLFQAHPDHRFYYCALITSGEVHAPSVHAWSWEALAGAAGGAHERAQLKWSYADSPFGTVGADRFGRVRAMFDARDRAVGSTEQAREDEGKVRLRAMETAMKALDEEGLFGSGERRRGIVINVEVMPPDHGNVERALRLNPREALVEWLDEAAEPEVGAG